MSVEKKNKSNHSAVEQEPVSFFKSKWSFLLAFVVLLMAATIYYLPSIDNQSISAHDYQQGVSNASELVKYHQETGQYAKWSTNMFSGMPTYQVWFSFNNLSSWISDALYNLTNPYVFIGLLISMSSVLLFYIIGVHPMIAVIGGFALMFSNFTIVSLMAGHNNKVMVMSLVPMTLAGIWALYEQEKYLLGLFVIAISMALQVRLNHVQITYFMMFLVGFWSLVHAVKTVQQKDFKHLILSVIVMISGIGLGALNNSTQLMTTLEYSKETQRGGPSPVEVAKNPETATHQDGVGYEYATSWSYGIAESFTLLIPNFSGGPEMTTRGKIDENNQIAQALLSQGLSVSNAIQVAQSLPTYWGNQPFVAGTTYMGAVLIFLMVLGFFFIQGYKRWWLVASFVVSLMVAWGDNLSVFYKLLFNYLPYFNKFRTPSMIFYLATIVAAISAALFLHRIVQDSQNREVLWDKFLKVGGGFVGLMLLMTLLGPFLFSFTSEVSDAGLRTQLLQMTGENQSMMEAIYSGLIQERKSMMRSDAIRSTIFILLAFGLIAAYLKRKLNAELMLGGIALVMLIDLVGVDLRYVNHDSFQDNISAGIEGPRATAADKEILKDQDLSYRVLDLTVSSFSEAKPSFYHKNIGGYHSVKLKRYQDLISYQINENLQKLQEGQLANAHVLNMLNARYLITSPEQNGVYKNQYAYGNAWLVEEVKVLDDAVKVFDNLMEEDLSRVALLEQPSVSSETKQTYQIAEDAQIELVEMENDKMKYDFNSSTEAYVVFSEIYYNSGKGWSAYIDGEKVEHDQVNYVLRGLHVPAGKHEIVFEFDSPTVRKTSKIDFATSILIIFLGIGAIVYPIVQRRKED